MLKKSAIVAFLVLLIDQWSKIWVKSHMYLGEEFNVLGNWFIIHFTENPGMAFGMEFGGDYGKLALSLFRILAVIGLCYYIYKLCEEKAPKGVIYSFALIMAGALGNILDSMFYGIVFNDSYNQVATMFPDSGGYASFLHGKVVDMLYFPLIEGHLPQWLPVWGGDYFLFFRPVFNIADVSISVGVGIIILFQRNFFVQQTDEEDVANTEESNKG